MNTNMVAKRLLFTPVPASSAGSTTSRHQDSRLDHISLADLAVHYPAFATDAPGYAKALCKLGYDCAMSLDTMHDGDPVRKL